LFFSKKTQVPNYQEKKFSGFCFYLKINKLQAHEVATLLKIIELEKRYG
jgi:hypothetical protein